MQFKDILDFCLIVMWIKSPIYKLSLKFQEQLFLKIISYKISLLNSQKRIPGY